MRLAKGNRPSTSSHQEIDDLRGEMAQIIGVVMALIGGLSTWILTPSIRYEPGPFAVALALLCTGALALLLAHRYPKLARLGLALGSMVVGTLQVYHGRTLTGVAALCGCRWRALTTTRWPV